MEYVYPKIKEYCREKHGLEYQVVNMLKIICLKKCTEKLYYDMKMNDAKNPGG